VRHVNKRLPAEDKGRGSPEKIKAAHRGSRRFRSEENKTENPEESKKKQKKNQQQMDFKER